MIQQINADYDKAQAYFDKQYELRRKADEALQVVLDISKNTALSALVVSEHNNSRQSKTDKESE